MRWDMVSAVLTLTSMLAIGQKKWQGWGLAFLNSVVVCVLALHVSPKQWALIPTNLFCLIIYARNLIRWHRDERRRKVSQPDDRSNDSPRAAEPATENSSPGVGMVPA